MLKVRSKDGTTIAFEQVGEGPPLILVVGAFNTRSTGAPLAAAMAPHGTVFTYDRRGRGDSRDTASYALEREVEDLGALIPRQLDRRQYSATRPAPVWRSRLPPAGWPLRS